MARAPWSRRDHRALLLPQQTPHRVVVKMRDQVPEIPHMEPSQPVECSSKPLDVQFAFE